MAKLKSAIGIVSIAPYISRAIKHISRILYECERNDIDLDIIY
jgi:hypothetical protein